MITPHEIAFGGRVKSSICGLKSRLESCKTYGQTNQRMIYPPILGQSDLSAFGLAIFANLLWGTSFLASKYTLQSWGPLTASALRFSIAILAIFGFQHLMGASIRVPRKKQELIWIGLISLTGFGLLYPLQLKGLTFITSSLSAAIMLTAPLFVILFNAILFKESITLRKIIAIFVGIAGGSLLLFDRGQIGKGTDGLWLGSVLTLGASVSLALSVVFTKKISSQLDSLNLTFWSMLMGLVFLIPFAIRETADSGFGNSSSRGLLALMYLAIICSVLCFNIWNRAISMSSPRELATTMHVKTPTAVLLGVCIAGESISVGLVAGAILVGIGVWISQSQPKAEER